jgi:hypothetical protein
VHGVCAAATGANCIEEIVRDRQERIEGIKPINRKGWLQEIQSNPTQTSMKHYQNLHRCYSHGKETIPQKSSSGIDPNSGKNVSKPSTKMGKKQYIEYAKHM